MKKRKKVILSATLARCIAQLIYKRQACELKALLNKNYRELKNRFPPINETAYNMLVLAEDRRFFKHGGFDLIAILRAVLKKIFFDKLEGGSTIEQQLVRTLTGNYEITFKRKIKEIMLASTIQNIMPKKNVLELYLGIAYYGYKMTGYYKAMHQLGLDQNKISPKDIALVIARLKYPEPCHFSAKRKLQIIQRANYILRLYDLLSLKNNLIKNYEVNHYGHAHGSISYPRNIEGAFQSFFR